MENQELKNKVKEPYSDYGRYTYADYLNWQLEDMVELIKGKVFKEAAEPRVNHQRISIKISSALFNFLNGKNCEVFTAPFDVRLSFRSKEHEDIDTVVQPDICVVCDPEKLDELGCLGAPDLIVEILSPGNNSKELQNKYEVYEESGVHEYWIIHPSECTLIIFSLNNGKYNASRIFTFGDKVVSQAVAGFELDLDGVFESLQ